MLLPRAAVAVITLDARLVLRGAAKRPLRGRPAVSVVVWYGRRSVPAGLP
jgi:hypothetical protein